MTFAAVGNLVDTEVRVKRPRHSAEQRVQATMRMLPEPTNVDRWRAVEDAGRAGPGGNARGRLG